VLQLSNVGFNIYSSVHQSLLAIFVRTLVPSYAKASTPQATWFKPIPQATGTPRRRIAHPLQRSLSVPVISSCPRSDIMLSSVIDGAVPHIHAPARVTESSIHQSNLIEVSTDIHEVPKGSPVLRPPSIIAYRAIVSPPSRQRSDRLRCKRSVEFLLRFCKSVLCHWFFIDGIYSRSYKGFIESFEKLDPPPRPTITNTALRSTILLSGARDARSH
jgi:hypothetical protein